MGLEAGVEGQRMQPYASGTSGARGASGCLNCPEDPLSQGWIQEA